MALSIIAYCVLSNESVQSIYTLHISVLYCGYVTRFWCWRKRNWGRILGWYYSLSLVLGHIFDVIVFSVNFNGYWFRYFEKKNRDLSLTHNCHWKWKFTDFVYDLNLSKKKTSFAHRHWSHYVVKTHTASGNYKITQKKLFLTFSIKPSLK